MIDIVMDLAEGRSVLSGEYEAHVFAHGAGAMIAFFTWPNMWGLCTLREAHCGLSPSPSQCQSSFTGLVDNLESMVRSSWVLNVGNSIYVPDTPVVW